MTYTITVSVPEPEVLELVLADEAGKTVDSERLPHTGPVDNLLLTTVDNLLKRNSIDRSALSDITAGQGIDKNSSLARIVTSFAAAVRASPQGAQALE